VEFITIFPGWYPGRVCHIHFQVYVSSVYAAVSQLTYDHTTKNNIYAANPGEYTKGADPLTPGTDGIFSDGHSLQLATLTPNVSTGGFDSFLEVAIQGAGTPTGLHTLEPETGGQFKLGQNLPNPYQTVTSIPFRLNNAADVTLLIWGLSGNCVAEIRRDNLGAGDHTIQVDLAKLGLSHATYVYELQTQNRYGTFRQCKVMTAQQ
jgi:hypothetical protein